MAARDIPESEHDVTCFFNGDIMFVFNAGDVEITRIMSFNLHGQTGINWVPPTWFPNVLCGWDE